MNPTVQKMGTGSILNLNLEPIYFYLNSDEALAFSNQNSKALFLSSVADIVLIIFKPSAPIQVKSDSFC